MQCGMLHKTSISETDCVLLRIISFRMLVLSRPYKVQVIHDSPGFWIPSCRFQILGTGFRITCQWNLDSGLLELNSGFQSPGVHIPGEKLPGFQNLDSLNVRYYIPTLLIMVRFAGLRSSRPKCWVMWLEILSCSTISQQPYYHLPRLFLQIKDYRTTYITHLSHLFCC